MVWPVRASLNELDEGSDVALDESSDVEPGPEPSAAAEPGPEPCASEALPRRKASHNDNTKINT